MYLGMPDTLRHTSCYLEMGTNKPFNKKIGLFGRVYLHIWNLSFLICFKANMFLTSFSSNLNISNKHKYIIMNDEYPLTKCLS